MKEEKEGLEMEEDFEGAIGDVEPGDQEDGGSGDDESGLENLRENIYAFFTIPVILVS